MQRGGIEIIQVSDDEGTSTSVPARKKAKGPKGQVISTKRVYDLSELESICAGAVPMTVDEELNLNKGELG